MMPGLTLLLGWTSCFALAVLVALSRRVALHRRAWALVVGSLAVSVLLSSVGTVSLAAAAFSWGCVVAWRLACLPEQRTSAQGPGRVAPTAPSVAWRSFRGEGGARLALMVAWALVTIVGIGTVVRLYVTFGADLSLHPTFGAREVVFRGIFGELAVLPMLLGLALWLRTCVEGGAGAPQPIVHREEGDGG